MPGRPLVLLVEDNAWDARVFQEALLEATPLVDLEVASDGFAALDFLRKTPPRRPDLVLLDLGLPGKNGHEVLAEVRADPALAGLRIVVLTSSLAERDIIRARELRADGYLQKPSDPDDYASVVATVCGILDARGSAP